MYNTYYDRVWHPALCNTTAWLAACMRGPVARRGACLRGDAAAQRLLRRAQREPEEGPREVAGSVAAKGAVGRKLVRELCFGPCGHKIDALAGVGCADAWEVRAVWVEDHQVGACHAQPLMSALHAPQVELVCRWDC